MAETSGGRSRFVRNVVGKIRAKVGKDLLIASRVNVFDGPPFAMGADGIGQPAYEGAYRWGFGNDAEAAAAGP